MMTIGEPFHPNPKMMALYTIYLFAFVLPLYALTTAFLVINFLYFRDMIAYILIISVGYAPLCVDAVHTILDPEVLQIDYLLYDRERGKGGDGGLVEGAPRYPLLAHNER
jgi:hypothetical protein